MFGAPLMLSAAASAASTLLSGLAGYWKLDGNGTDELGANTFVSRGTPAISYAAGKIGQAATFGASNGMYVASPTSALHPTAGFTIAAWIYPTVAWSSLTNARILNDWHQSTAADRWIFYVSGGGVAWYVCDANEVQSLTSSFGSPSLNAWHLLVGTADRNGTKAYVDAALSASSSFWSPPRSFNAHNAAASIGIGSQPDGTGGGFTGGLIDEVGIWNRALSQAEVTELYNGGAGKAYPFN